MSRISELDLDRQQVEQIREDKSSQRSVLNDNVRDRLTSIAKGAEIVSRNVRALPFKPGFKPGAQWALEDSEKALEEALQKVRAAMAEYDAKAIA